MQLFAQKGYGSTSVADILQAAGVNAGSLYYLYPGKQDVLLDVLDTYLAGIRPMLLAPAWEGVADPIERVFALLRRYRFALESTDCTYGCPIGSIALELHEPDPPVRQRLAANFDAWVGAIEQCFVDAGDRLPADLDHRVGDVLRHRGGACASVDPAVEEALHGADPPARAEVGIHVPVYGVRPLVVRMGGTVPISELFQRHMGRDTVFFSFSTADEDYHAPNEFFRVHRLHEGLEAWARLWDILGRSAA